ncbi:hypothetical protein SAMN05444156_0586 [Verrucomicrobium sp. GAS474]|uniref:hypothetical protein n=1 Tax=Verrucomicrobium sp. GAS474 TaxID=1882831 RepID=UPI00087CE454|nr:hypothetical protein [Verrucomicrobium sp. GAS474]SDT90269.1 hypothetical protein SAMN05444156_0586 [Verrucomicrobium sp. GAS474]
MVHHICQLQTYDRVNPEAIETIMVETRIRLLKIPEVSNLRVGKRIDKVHNPFTLFFSYDVDNMEKLRQVHDSAVYIQFQRQIIEPNVSWVDARNYEMEPGKDVAYS